MSISLIQLILASIATLLFINTLSKFLKGAHGQTFFKLTLSFFVWGSIFLLALLPGLGHALSKKLGMGGNLNTLIFIGFIVIFIILFKILNVIERVEQNISEIIRKDALKKITSRSK